MKAAMKTVKDFKDAGLVISEKDMIDGVTGDADSQAVSIGYTTNNGDMAVNDAWTIREFAWREKTSIILSFIGEIECMNENNQVIEGPIFYFACTKWRPLLKQNTVDVSVETPEEKEVLDKIFGADSAPNPSKTVWDAVSELRGDLKGVVGFNLNHKGLWFNADESKYLTQFTENSKLGGFSYKYVSTIAEFNALVEEMELGLDVNTVTKHRAWAYLYEAKTPLEKETKPDYKSLEFWKGAPKGYDYAVIRNEATDNVSFYKDAPTYQCIFKYGNHHYMLCFKKGSMKYNAKYYHVVKRPQSTPIETPEEKEALDSTVNNPLVYTQDMDDDGVKPSVGAECLIYNAELMNPEYEKATIDFVGCHVIVYSSESCTERTCNLDLVKFKPIDTRTKKEKAIDDIIDKVGSFSETSKKSLSAAFDEWVGE